MANFLVMNVVPIQYQLDQNGSSMGLIEPEFEGRLQMVE